MIPPRLILRDGASVSAWQPWIDAMTQILTGGFSFGDQVAKLVTATWNSDRMTPIAVGGTTPPIAVLCLSARTGQTTISPVVVTWTWSAGSITITAAPDLAASTDYTLILLPVRG